LIAAYYPPAKLLDQFAFKPGGSTTDAVVHQLTEMLEQNVYVRLMIDFTKVFDTVDHVT